MASEPPKSSVTKATLFCVLPIQGLLSQHDAGFVADPSDRTLLQNLWHRANEAYARLVPSRSYIAEDDLRPIEEVDKSKVEKTLSRVRTYSPFDTHHSEILNARISKLVTPQITLNLPRADKRTKLKKEMPEDELFDLAFGSAGQPEPITRQALAMAPNGGALLFTSYDEDIRLHHPPQYRRIPINESDQDSPTFESVCLPVGGGLPFAAARRIQIAPGVSRLILGNGIHRIYKLAIAGHEWCPVVVTDMGSMETPDPFVDLPKDILLNPMSNPPLISDFTNEDLVIRLDYFRVLKTIRLNWNLEQYATVLK